MIPNFKIYSFVKSKPFWKLSLSLKMLPKTIPSKIAIIAVEMGLLSYPNNSIPIILLNPWDKV